MYLETLHGLLTDAIDLAAEKQLLSVTDIQYLLAVRKHVETKQKRRARLDDTLTSLTELLKPEVL